jgi:membrane protease YdiL (CAAX protease family)
LPLSDISPCIGGAPCITRQGLFYLTTIAWEWILVAYVNRGLRRRGKSIRNIAGRSWKSVSDFLMNVAISFGFSIAAIFVLRLVAQVVGSKGMSQAVRFLARQGPYESLLWIALAVTAGICEETIFRGYLQRQFVAWTRSAPIGVLLSAALFGAGHIYQGAKATVVMGFGSEAWQNPGRICVPESSPTRGMTRSPVWSFVFCRREATKEFLRKQRSFRRRRTGNVSPLKRNSARRKKQPGRSAEGPRYPGLSCPPPQ